MEKNIYVISVGSEKNGEIYTNPAGASFSLEKARETVNEIDTHFKNNPPKKKEKYLGCFIEVVPII